MIRTLDNGIKIIELGLGTTNISQVVPKGETVSSGICFSNNNNNNNPSIEGLSGEEIIIEINGYKGILAYLMPIVELIESYACEDDNIKNVLKELQESIKSELDDEILEKDWSDRCVSCRSYDDKTGKCKNEKSKMCRKEIKYPNKQNCDYWRYKF